MSIRINSNNASLNVQRQLGQTTRELSRVSDRLASGLRINRAVDDAAGLAISSALDVDARVFSQAVRNIDDGLSYLSIAEGAGTELKNILIRMRELATQSSNGTYSNPQRLALNAEASKLQEEYNRIVESVEFNGRKIFAEPDSVSESGSTSLSSSTLSVQAGYGLLGSINVRLGEIATAYQADGAFASPVDYFGSSVSLGGLRTQGDVDNDGDIDIVSEFGTALNSGDGTFTTLVSSPGLGVNSALILEDVNSDGNLDIIGTNISTNVFVVAFGNGNGTFKAGTSTSSGNYPSVAHLADVNGDSVLDLLIAAQADQTIRVSLGNGNGSFKSPAVYLTNSNAITGFEFGDFNEDGAIDVLVAGSNVGNDRILFGNGNGTFGAPINTTTSTGNQQIEIGDFNNDGHLDYIGVYNGAAQNMLYLGNGNGTFKAVASHTGIAGYEFAAADFNGDGNLDFVKGLLNGSVTTIQLGNGNGTFLAPVSYGVNAQGASLITVGDVTGEGVLDLVGGMLGANYTLRVLAGNYSTELTVNSFQSIEPISVASVTEARAAQTRLDELLATANQALGFIGTGASRLLSAREALVTRRDSYREAQSRITDADIAFESAQLLRLKILQQSATAVLAQANQGPRLALKLLGVE